MEEMELKVMLARFDERQKAIQDKLDIIHTEVKKTNGRVTHIESSRLPKLEHWKSRVHGIYLALAAGATVLAFIIGAILELGK